MNKYILLMGYWYFSMNTGEDCESDVVAIFDSQKDLDKYISEKGIELGKVKLTYADEDRITGDKEWYYTQELTTDENKR